MAENLTNDAGRIIDAIDGASEEELRALTGISRQIKNLAEKSASSSADSGLASENPSSRAPVTSSGTVPRSVIARQKQLQKEQEKAWEKQSKNIENALTEQREQFHTEKPKNSSLNTLKKQQKNNENLDSHNLSKKASPNQPINNKNASYNHPQSSDKKAEAAPRDAYRISKNLQREGPVVDSSGKLRDEKGRFLPASVMAAQEARDRQTQQRQSASGAAGDGRLAKILSGLSDPFENEKVDEVGQAAGSTFWKSGKEMYDIGKSAVSGSVNGVGKIRRLGDVDEGQGAKQGWLTRLRARKGNMPASAEAINRNQARETARTLVDQTQAIKDGDEKIVDRLDELLKAQDKKRGGGLMSGLLGGALLGAIGKMGAGIAEKILAALGMKKLADAIGRKRRPRLPGAGGDNCGCDVDLPGGKDRKKRNTRRDKAREKRRKRAREKAAKNGPKPAAAETTSVAADKAKDRVVKEGAKEAAKDATEAAGKKAAKEAAVAEAAKATATVTEKAAGKTATTAAEKAATKTGSTAAGKAAEKAGVKAVTKLGLKGALRLIPGLGTAITMGLDAYDGATDTEAQKAAFGTDKVDAKQKTAYTVANVLSMGGLADTVTGYLSEKARSYGFNNTADSLGKFNTAHIANGVNNSLTKAGNLLGLGDPKDGEKARAELVKSIETSAEDTTQEVKKGFTALLDYFKSSNKVQQAATAVSDTWDSTKAAAVNSFNETKEFFGGKAKATVLTKKGKETLDGLDGYMGQLEARDGLPAGMLRSIATNESAGNPLAKSGAGAQGLNQLMPATAADLGLKGNDVWDPAKNTEAASRYMKQLLKQTGGDVDKALAAYNWGIGNVKKYGMKNMPKETRDYIARYHANHEKIIADRSGQAAKKPVELAGQVVPAVTTAPLVDTSPNARNTFTENGQTYRKAEMPLDGTAAGAAIASVTGLDGLRTAPGLRHQEPEQHAQSARRNKEAQVTQVASRQESDIYTAANGQRYRKASLPTDHFSKDTAVGQITSWALDKIGAENLRTAAGMRHNVSDNPNALSGTKGAGKLPVPGQIGVDENGIPIVDGSVLNKKFLASTGEPVPAAPAIPGQIGTDKDGTAIVDGAVLNKRFEVSPKAPAVAPPKTPAVAPPQTPAMMPAKSIAVPDLSASHVKPAVQVANEGLTLDKATMGIFTRMTKMLEEIAGHTKETASAKDSGGGAAPATAQPSPRGNIPLDINDPVMQQMANDGQS